MWSLERGLFTLGLNCGKKSFTGKKTETASRLPSSSVHSGAVKRSREEGGFSPSSSRLPICEPSPFPSFSLQPGPTRRPHLGAGSEAAPPPARLPPRGPLRPKSPARRGAATMAVTCPGSRQVRPLLRRSDSQMVRQEEPQQRLLRPSPKGLRRLLASPRGSD